MDYIIEQGTLGGWNFQKFKSGKIIQTIVVWPATQISRWGIGIAVNDPQITASGIGKSVLNLKVTGIQYYEESVELECYGGQIDTTSPVRIVVVSN